MAKHRTYKTAADFERIPVRRGNDVLLLNLIELGCGFNIAGDTLTVTGSGASPVLQSLVNRRAAALLALLREWGLGTGVLPRVPTVPTVAADDRMALIRRGVENAQRNAAKPKRYGRRVAP